MQFLLSGNRFRMLLGLMVLLSSFDLLLLAGRMHSQGMDWSRLFDIGYLLSNKGQVTFLFLAWNLFLAWVPVLLSTWMVHLQASRWKHLYFFGIFIVWIFFWPNAPYLLTDLLHLRQRFGVPIWYDLFLLLSFAWTGLMLGLISLMQVQLVVNQKLERISQRRQIKNVLRLIQNHLSPLLL